LAEPVNKNLSAEQQQQYIQQPNSVGNTMSDMHICVLCRKKFQTFEKLKVHKEISELHMVSEAQDKEEAFTVIPQASKRQQAKYTDRVSKRRNLYDKLPAVMLTHEPLRFNPISYKRPAMESAASTLVAGSIGNDMYQKTMVKSIAFPRTRDSTMTENM
jgi:hypothetical protein